MSSKLSPEELLVRQEITRLKSENGALRGFLLELSTEENSNDIARAVYEWASQQEEEQKTWTSENTS